MSLFENLSSIINREQVMYSFPDDVKCRGDVEKLEIPAEFQDCLVLVMQKSNTGIVAPLEAINPRKFGLGLSRLIRSLYITNVKEMTDDSQNSYHIMLIKKPIKFTDVGKVFAFSMVFYGYYLAELDAQKYQIFHNEEDALKFAETVKDENFAKELKEKYLAAGGINCFCKSFYFTNQTSSNTEVDVVYHPICGSV